MNGQQHYREAERLLEAGARVMIGVQRDLDEGEDLDGPGMSASVAHAAVLAHLGAGHAMLALADSQTPPDTHPVDPSTGGALRTIGRTS